MLGTLKDFKYKLIKNFISQDEVNLIDRYMLMTHVNNETDFDNIQSDVYDTMKYGDVLAESLMLVYQKKMEEICNLKLLPTYSFFRTYSKYADLKKHTDRPSCEISATIAIGSDGTKWPIYMEGAPVVMEPGDACVYLGCELEHWREPFEGDYSNQIFIHYVDANGPNKHLKFDQRPTLGVNKP